MPKIQMYVCIMIPTDRTDWSSGLVTLSTSYGDTKEFKFKHPYILKLPVKSNEIEGEQS